MSYVEISILNNIEGVRVGHFCRISSQLNDWLLICYNQSRFPTFSAKIN